jgi:hypothetical protein
MELKPVVHHNGSLNFEASNALENVMANINWKLLGFLFALWGTFVLQSLKIFRISGYKVSPGYLVVEFALALLTIWVSCYQANRIGSVVVKIGKKVSITDEMVSIAPYTFSFYFWRQKPTHNIEFKINELKIRKTDNPLRFTWVLDDRVFELRDKEKEAYIVFDFFDKTLKEKLTDILVEVTPPKLLVPGRLRHY